MAADTTRSTSLHDPKFESKSPENLLVREQTAPDFADKSVATSQGQNAGLSLVAKAAFEEPRDLFSVLALRPRSVCYAPGGMTRLRIRVLAGNRGDAASALIPVRAESRRATPVRVSGDPRRACP
jgi:hypothetical protein